MCIRESIQFIIADYNYPRLIYIIIIYFKLLIAIICNNLYYAERGFNAFKFNSTLGERNGIKGEERWWMGKKRDNVGWTAVSVSCVFLRPLYGKLSTFAPPRVDVCAQSGSGKRSRSVFKPALFSPSSLSTSTSLFDPRRNAERPLGMGLSNVASGRRSPFYFAAGFSFLGFLSPTAQYACRFPRMFRISTSGGCSPPHISPRFRLPLLRERPARRQIR